MNVPWLITATIGIVGLLGVTVGMANDTAQRIGEACCTVAICMAGVLGIAALWAEFA